MKTIWKMPQWLHPSLSKEFSSFFFFWKLTGQKQAHCHAAELYNLNIKPRAEEVIPVCTSAYVTMCMLVFQMRSKLD